MAYIGEIKVGDMIVNEYNYPNLDNTFKEPLKVTRIDNNAPSYAGGAFVFVQVYRGVEMGFYIKSIKKVN